MLDNVGLRYPPLAALTFAASSIICAFGLASAAPRSPYRHLELCGIALNKSTTQKRTAHPIQGVAMRLLLFIAFLMENNIIKASASFFSKKEQKPP